MKLYYVAHARMPTEKAHGIQIAEMCHAFSEVGYEVELLVPARKNAITQDLFSYYGVPKTFTVRFLPTTDLVRFGFFGFLYTLYSFRKSVQQFLKDREKGVVYGRDERVLSSLLRKGLRIVWESHSGVWNSGAEALVKGGVPLVVISSGLKKFYESKGVPSTQLLVAHDGVAATIKEELYDKAHLREILSLPGKEFLTVYTGKLDSWKGVTTLLKASQFLKGESTIVVVGGSEEEAALLRTKYPHVRFVSHVLPEVARRYQRAADVLVLPNTEGNTISKYYTSPLKLFDYMASGNPIVLSDLPSLREVVDDTSAFFFKPDDAEDLAKSVVYVKAHAEDALARAALAKERVGEYTWQKRAQSIRDFLEKN